MVFVKCLINIGTTSLYCEVAACKRQVVLTRRARRVTMPVMLLTQTLCALVLCLAVVTPPSDCNQFETVQRTVASEGRYQPPEVLRALADVAITHGACRTDRGFWGGWGVADDLRDDDVACLKSYACLAVEHYELIPADVREPIAIAAHMALTQPRKLYHAVAAKFPLPSFMNNSRACPNTYSDGERWFVLGDWVFC